MQVVAHIQTRDINFRCCKVTKGVWPKVVHKILPPIPKEDKILPPDSQRGEEESLRFPNTERSGDCEAKPTVIRKIFQANPSHNFNVVFFP